MKVCTRAGDACLRSNIKIDLTPYLGMERSKLMLLRALLELYEKTDRDVKRLQERIFEDGGRAIFLPAIAQRLNKNSTVMNLIYWWTLLGSPAHCLYDLFGDQSLWSFAWLAFSLVNSKKAWDLQQDCITLFMDQCFRQLLVSDIMSSNTRTSAFHPLNPAPGTMLAAVYREAHDLAGDEAREFVIGAIDVAVARALRRLEAKEKQQEP